MDDAALHRRFAADYFNRTWELIDRGDRSADDDARMLTLAHASLAHWLEVGGPQEWSVGNWQIARVLVLLGRDAEAADRARAAVAIADQAGLAPFWRASAREGLARALRRSRPAEAAAAAAEVRALAALVEDADDRALVLNDLEN